MSNIKNLKVNQRNLKINRAYHFLPQLLKKKIRNFYAIDLNNFDINVFCFHLLRKVSANTLKMSERAYIKKKIRFNALLKNIRMVNNVLASISVNFHSQLDYFFKVA